MPTQNDPKLLAILSWVFAPISGFLWKDSPNNLVNNHARESFYLGSFNILTFAAALFLQICSSITFSLAFAPLELVVSCLWGIVWMIIFASIIFPRIIGIIKALRGEQWHVPYITNFMMKYLKL